MFFKILKNKIILSIFFITVILLSTLSIYIPKVTEQSTIDFVVKNSKTTVKQIKLTREYYVQEVVGDIKKFAPNIKFDYDHAGVDGKIAFPTSLVHELSDIYSKNTGTQIKLYSKYPFKPKEDRKLSPTQLEALTYVENNDEGIWIKRDTINGTNVMRVAVADFMTQEACVSCHNSHVDKTWDFTWKLGDTRGVLEVITPIDEAINANQTLKNEILFSVFISMAVILLVYSITLYKREEELLDKNDNLETLVEGQTKTIKKNLDIMGKYIIYSKTDAKGIITEVSNAFCEISQYKKEELLGRSHSIVRHPDMEDKIFKNLWQTIESQKTWSGEIKNKKKDGTFYWTLANITPEFDEKGNLLGYLSIRQDITSNKELENNTKKLIETEKLISLGEMIGNIAHQWRQPLSAITSRASSVKMFNSIGSLESSEIDENMDKIIDKSNYLSDTINTFRNFIKSDKSLDNIDIDKAIEESHKIIEIILTDNQIKLINNIEFNKNLKIIGIESELVQVIINIISNAKDILLEKQIINPWVKLESYIKNNTFILSIEDNAGGIPDDIISNIFNPYFTTKHQSQGTGLGLHMSYQIIMDTFNGKLYAKNTNNGAKFFIELPLM